MSVVTRGGSNGGEAKMAATDEMQWQWQTSESDIRQEETTVVTTPEVS
jgi:hypothetical protein